MEVRGVCVEFQAEVEMCRKCGQYSIPGRVADEFGRRLDVAYRKAAGLLTVQEIIAARKRLGFKNQREFADYLGVGEASVKRWEAGALLDKSNSELIRLKTDLGTARRNAEKIAVLEEQGAPNRRASQRVVLFPEKVRPQWANWRRDPSAPLGSAESQEHAYAS